MQRTGTCLKILRRTSGKAALTAEGWKLLAAGKQLLAGIVPDIHDSSISRAALGLRQLAKKLGDGPLFEFVLEAVRCVEQRTWRAAIVLSWVGALYHLQDIVFRQYLSQFNSAAAARFPRAKLVKSMDGFASVQEADFLQLCEDIGLLGKSAKSC